MEAPLVKKSFYLPELDVLRAGAFFAVFVSHWVPKSIDYYVHAGMPRTIARAMVAVSDSSATGVMLFFCLSAYLITQLLLKEIETRGHIDVPTFYLRRVLRIWPLYLAFTLVAALAPLVDAQQHFGGKAIAAFLLFGGNWIWALRLPVETIALPLWSISVEEQFYLCWPWVVRRATRRGLRNIVLGLFVVAAIDRVLVVGGVLPVDLWHNTLTQLDSIGLGALLALGTSERLEALKRRARPLLIVGALLAIYLVSLTFDPSDTAISSLFFYPVVAFACAVVLFATVGVPLDRASPLVRAAVYLGKISYGLYVFHYACFYVVTRMLALSPRKLPFALVFAARGAGAMALTIGLATLSYRYIEKPALRWKARFS